VHRADGGDMGGLGLSEIVVLGALVGVPVLLVVIVVLVVVRAGGRSR
jgi:hypothetical protein